MTAIKYILFAIIATALNLCTQYACLSIYNNFGSLYLAMLAGTLVGLLSKYILDKKFIFYHQPINKVDDFKKFIRYLIMGIFTTILFWGTEISFDLAFDYVAAKYVGAIIGLSIGYIIKYFLDKKFVFNYG